MADSQAYEWAKWYGLASSHPLCYRRWRKALFEQGEEIVKEIPQNYDLQGMSWKKL
jgi:hypothetical protein